MNRFTSKFVLFLVVVIASACSGGGKDDAIAACAVYFPRHTEFFDNAESNQSYLGLVSDFGKRITAVLNALDGAGADVPSELRKPLEDEDYRDAFIILDYEKINLMLTEIGKRHDFIVGQCAQIND